MDLDTQEKAEIKKAMAAALVCPECGRPLRKLDTGLWVCQGAIDDHFSNTLYTEKSLHAKGIQTYKLVRKVPQNAAA